MNTTGIERRIRAKLKKYIELNEYGGYITPSEVVYCVDKLEFKLAFEPEKAWATKAIKEGKSNPSWVYFCITKTIQEFMR